MPAVLSRCLSRQLSTLINAGQTYTINYEVMRIDLVLSV